MRKSIISVQGSTFRLPDIADKIRVVKSKVPCNGSLDIFSPKLTKL